MRRAWLLAQTLWTIGLVGVLCAPNATAEGVASALSWSGLKDSHGVPLGAYYISMVNVGESMRTQVSDASLLEPGTWVPALVSASTAGMSYSVTAALLGMCCGFLVFIVAASVWFIKFALSVTWLQWLAQLAAPILVSIQQAVSYLHVTETALVICMSVGAMVALTKGVGRGMGMMFSGLLVVLLSAWLLNDPVNELAGPNGVLGMGRWLGLSVSMGVVNNGPIAGGDVTNAQVDALGAWMVDTLARQPVQLVNFGTVIDTDANCASAWDAALLTGSSTVVETLPLPGHATTPVEAMKACGNTAAYAYAAHLSGEAVGLFGLLNFIVAVVLVAMCYVALEVVRIGFKAFWHTFVLIPAAAVAVAPGPQRQYAKKTGLKSVVFGVEMMAATAGLGVIVILMARTARGDLVAVDAPIGKLMVMLLVALGATGGFRKLMHGFGDAGLPTPWSVARGAARFAWRNPMQIAAGKRIFDKLRSRRNGERGGEADGVADDGSGGLAAPGRRAHPHHDERAAQCPRCRQSRCTCRDDGGSGNAQRSTGSPESAASSQPKASKGGAAATAAKAARTTAKVGEAFVAPEKAAAAAAGHVAKKTAGRVNDAVTHHGDAAGRTGHTPTNSTGPGFIGHTATAPEAAAGRSGHVPTGGDASATTGRPGTSQHPPAAGGDATDAAAQRRRWERLVPPGAPQAPVWPKLSDTPPQRFPKYPGQE
ncbi:hypothetical protein KIH27_20300 [Mycobacterium sp. M1]|uniref:TrbL/VirB6 plasmid conjugal transfer protein n=1 Tax=Mycolicibacter acidiphilus TaxID=2835306 RepID=A0ABS5RQT1_9MYCO|nr:hypothetical protein [Mycolicibacter acidiphilus]MBS9535928.1 hypothetical protein [Mycolicibacter acidiphilus]